MLQQILDALRQYRIDLLTRESGNIDQNYIIDKQLLEAERLLSFAIRLKGEKNES